MDWVQALAAALAANRPTVMATVVGGPPHLLGQHALWMPDGMQPHDFPLGLALTPLAREVLEAGRPRTVAVSDARIYLEPFLPAPKLLVCGAGHVAQPLVQMAQLAGFAVTVVDDRPDYASPERFPGASQVICAEFVPAIRSLNPKWGQYCVLVTRGHQHDVDCLRELLGQPLAYLGMIGSRTRVQAVRDLLAAEGVDGAALESVHAPIGLDIGAHTPAEIALAIVAELVAVRRGGSGQPLSQLHRDRVHGTALAPASPGLGPREVRGDGR